MHGNHDGAPMGWLATKDPLVSSSQPMSPHRPGTGAGLPAYRMSTWKRVLTGTGRAGGCAVFPPVRVNFAARPSTATRSSRNPDRSRLRRESGGCVDTAVRLA
ncbi:hypothetical protein [Fodinicola feengrottensis]